MLSKCKCSPRSKLRANFSDTVDFPVPGGPVIIYVVAITFLNYKIKVGAIMLGQKSKSLFLIIPFFDRILPFSTLLESH